MVKMAFLQHPGRTCTRPTHPIPAHGTLCQLHPAAIWSLRPPRAISTQCRRRRVRAQSSQAQDAASDSGAAPAPSSQAPQPVATATAATATLEPSATLDMDTLKQMVRVAVKTNTSSQRRSTGQAHRAAKHTGSEWDGTVCRQCSTARSRHTRRHLCSAAYVRYLAKRRQVTT